MIGFLQEAEGENSLSRLLILFIMANAIIAFDALIIVGVVKYIKTENSDALVAIVATAGTMLGVVSGVAGAWKYSSKAQEIKQADNDEL